MDGVSMPARARGWLRDARTVTSCRLETHLYEALHLEMMLCPNPPSFSQPEPASEAQTRARTRSAPPELTCLPSSRSCRHCPGTAKRNYPRGVRSPPVPTAGAGAGSGGADPRP